MDESRSVAGLDTAGSKMLLRLRLVPAALRAAAELARARLQHVRLTPQKIQKLNRRACSARPQTGRGAQAADLLVERVAFVIPRVAARLPWRSDCLIQAMAAQRWLMAKGIVTTITIGVDRPQGGQFSAHAWLQYGDRIVTGGEISAFSPLLVPESG